MKETTIASKITSPLGSQKILQNRISNLKFMVENHEQCIRAMERASMMIRQLQAQIKARRAVVAAFHESNPNGGVNVTNAKKVDYETETDDSGSVSSISFDTASVLSCTYTLASLRSSPKKTTRHATTRKKGPDLLSCPVSDIFDCNKQEIRTEGSLGKNAQNKRVFKFADRKLKPKELLAYERSKLAKNGTNNHCKVAEIDPINNLDQDRITALPSENITEMNILFDEESPSNFSSSLKSTKSKNGRRSLNMWALHSSQKELNKKYVCDRMVRLVGTEGGSVGSRSRSSVRGCRSRQVSNSNTLSAHHNQLYNAKKTSMRDSRILRTVSSSSFASNISKVGWQIVD